MKKGRFTDGMDAGEAFRMKKGRFTDGISTGDYFKDSLRDLPCNVSTHT